jgi:phospholipase D1/2
LRLQRADRYARLRIVLPRLRTVIPKPVFIHSKVLIDERFARIGSSNFNNRFRGRHTECDLAIEASSHQQRSAMRLLNHQAIRSEAEELCYYSPLDLPLRQEEKNGQERADDGIA